MKTIYSEKLPRILKNKKKLEKELNVKITNRGKEIYIKGKAEDEYIADQVITALNFGFLFQAAIAIKKQELMFEIINIKDYAKTNNFKRIRARIIGKSGKTLKTLCELTDCFIELNENQLGIIGKPEHMKITQEAIINLIKGSKQTNVYKFLEKHQLEPILDLGLKK